MDDEDEDLPRVPRVPRLVVDAGSGAIRDSGPIRAPIDPLYYLTQEPTERVRAIVAATTRDSGAPSPMWMTATLADRVAQVERQQIETQRQLSDVTAAIRGLTEALEPARIDRIERAQADARDDAKRARSHLWKAGGVAATLLVSALAWFLHTIEARAAAFQKLDDLIERFDDFDKDIREMRMQLNKLSKADPSRESSIPIPPDKLSFRWSP